MLEPKSSALAIAEAVILNSFQGPGWSRAPVCRRRIERITSPAGRPWIF
jgi:hypothetical protein